MKKRITAALLAVSMILSLIPSAFAADAPADIVYDFTTYTKGWSKLLYKEDQKSTIPSGIAYEDKLVSIGSTKYYIVQPADKNFSFNYSLGAIDWKTGTTSSGGGATRVAANTNWYPNAPRYTKAGIFIEVDNPGWYSPSFTGGLTSVGYKASIYVTKAGEDASQTSYLGDYDFTTDDTSTSSTKCVVGPEKKLNAVYLTAGTHTLWFCFRAGKNGSYPFFINFKLSGLGGKPQITGIESALPTLCKGDSAQSDVSVTMSDGSLFGLAEYKVNEYTQIKEDLTDKNYITVTSDEEAIAKVTDVKRAGVGYSEKFTYTVTGTGVGTTNLVFTPYIDGTAQESYKKEITISAPPKLDEIELSAESDELALGRETVVSVTSLIRDDNEIYTRDDYEIEYTSSNTEVLEVEKIDETSCRVISKGIGNAKVIASATAPDLTEPVVETVDISVFERPILSAIELTTEKTSVNVGDTGTVSVKSLTMSDGLPAFSAEDYEFSWENDNEAAISFDEATGAFSALSLGTSEIRVSATNENGKKIYGKLLISVIEKSDEPVSDKSIVVDFGKTVTEKIDGKWTVVSTSGYEIVTSKSNMGTWICGACPDGVSRLRINAGATKPEQCWPLKTSAGASVTFTVDVPTAGYYAVFFTGGIHNRGAVYSSYLDNSTYLGDYDFRGPNAVDKADRGERKQLNTVYLEAGKHEFTFKGRTHYSNPYLSLEKLELIPLEITEINAADIVADESISLAVGETLSDIEAYVKMSDNSPYSFGYTGDGKVNGANFFGAEASNESISLTYSDEYTAGDTELHKFDILGVTPGESGIVLKSFINNGSEVSKTVPVTVTDEVLDSVELGISKKLMFKDDTATLSAAVTLDSGRVPAVASDAIVYSADSDVVQIEGNTLTALRAGTAEVKVSVTLGSVTKTDSITLTVFDGGIADMKITAGGSEYIRLGDVVPVYVTGITTDGLEVDFTGDEDLTYESLTPDICEVDEGGNLIPKKAGKATVKVTELTDGGSKSFEAELSVIAGKTGFSIYTEAERANALENAKKYAWAKSMAKTTEEEAEKYVKMLDVLYDGLPSEGVMRSMTVGEFNDPEKYYCRYCGKNLLSQYGDPPFLIDPVSRPWKVQCPDCKRLFPSNDFGSFYELGLNEYGEFDRLRALEAHRDMLLKKGKIDTSVTSPGEECSDTWYAYYGYGVEGGYLHNDTYNELYDPSKPSCNIDPVKGVEIDGKRWGVDDGFGYMPGRNYYSKNDSGQEVVLCEERHNYVAYYLYYFYAWYYMPAITDSADAYLYTGKPEYGYTAAILLDRLADFYPSYDLSLYGTKIWAAHGGLYNGKYMGSITESVEDAYIISAYDAVYALYDDSTVLNYIANKNNGVKMRHAKKSAAQIRTNVEDGLLREMLMCCTTGDVRGNFGFSQAVMAAAAVALDNGEETIEWLDFLVQPGFVRIGEVTGGGLYDWLITYVDSDAQPNEASLYNYNWLTYLLSVQNYLDDYTDKYDKANLRTFPRYVNMFYSFLPVILSTYNANYGDSSRWMLTTGSIWMQYKPLITAYRWTGDTTFLKVLYMKYNGDVSQLNEGIFVKDPENIRNEVLRVVEEEGKHNPPSQTMTQFGFSVIRDGEDFRTNYGTSGQDFRRNFWMYFGYNGGHGHKDSLNLGMDAFGYNFMPDLGYPETTGTQPNRLQWISATLSHNTVVVDENNQQISDKRANPMHFDDTEMVKLMDVDAKEVYPQTDIYRRSVLMIKIDDQISYGVDFFRVKGGDKHEFSFHATSDEVYEVKGLGTVEKQTDADGNYIGTYASPDYDYGEDPVSPNASYYKTFYPRGYTWLEKIDRYNSPEKQFEVDFKIKDFEKDLPDSNGLHLRATMLGIDTSNTKVTFADGYPARAEQNKNIPSLRYMFVKREGEDLDSLFTTVLEPYRNTRTLSAIEELTLTKKDGYEQRSDEARALKVTLANGRVDYIFYATNNAVTYELTDGEGEDAITLLFRGFAGVYTVQNGENTYRYVCDGDIIGEAEAVTDKTGIYGRVSSFTQELSENNEILLTYDGELTDEEAAALAGRYVFIENDGVRNGAYPIKSAELRDGKLALNTGRVDYIRALVDKNDMESGFTYNIAPRQDAYIPLSYSENEAYPYFTVAPGTLSVSAGSTLTTSFKAENESGSILTYKGTVLPRGASVDAATGELRWRPDASQVGDNHVAITAYDEFGRETTANVMISVYGSTTSKPSTDNENDSGASAGTDSTGASGGGGGGGGGGGATDSSTSENTGTSGETDNGDTSDQNGETAPDASGETEKLRFTDLGNHAWARDAINSLAADGIIKGTTATTYSPAANITRADFALLLVRAFNLESDNTENFADVAADDYFAPELAVARNTGIVNGIGDNKFAPRNPITRQDMMVIVYRAIKPSLPKGSEAERNVDAAMNDSPVDYQNRGVTEPGEKGTAEWRWEDSASVRPSNDGGGIPAEYPDWDSVAPYARDAVSALISAGIVNGKNGLIAPTDFTTRAEVAVLLKRILEHKASLAPKKALLA